MKIKGLKKRWLLNSMLITLVIVIVSIAAFAVAVSSNYYIGVQTSLENKAKTATDFFANYITKTYAEYYQSAYQYTERFDERDKLELQFINTGGSVEISTYGITAGTSPALPK